MDAQLSISWEAQKAFMSGLIDLQQKGEYVDMTLAADGHFVRVHQLVLALCSPYIGGLIKTAQIRNNGHPILFLNGISYKTLSYLLEYMYTGEVCVSIENLVEFMDAGKKLHIRGIEKLENPLLTVQKRTETHKSDSEEYNIIQVGNQSDEDNALEVEQEDAAPMSAEPVPNVQEDKEMEYEIPIEPDAILSEKSDNPPKPIRILPKPTSTPVLEKHQIIRGPIQSNMQYTISNRGSLQMIFNRFMYYAKYTRKSRSRQWRCVDYLTNNLKCPAYVVTRENDVLQRVHTHNHLFHDEKILKKIRAGAVYTSIDELKTKGKQDNEDTITKSSENIRNEMDG